MKQIMAVVCAFFALTSLDAVGCKKSNECDKACNKCACHCKSKECCAKKCDPNHRQKAPDLDSAELKGSQVEVRGGLRSVPHTKFMLEFYNSSDECCNGEGDVLLGRLTVETDQYGEATFIATLPCSCVCGGACTRIAATATRIRGKKLTDTSVFSHSVKVEHKHKHKHSHSYK